MPSIHRQALVPLYLPALLLGIPAQASLILLPLYVLELGGSPSTAAAVVGARALGMMAMDIPAGMWVARWGEKRVMVLAGVLISVCFFAYATLGGTAWFYPIAFISGCGGSSFLLARMSYVTAGVASAQRGRVIAMLAGAMRVAALVGPLCGGLLAQWLGYGPTFVLGGIIVACGSACVMVASSGHERQQSALKWHAIPKLAFDHRRVFASAGVAAVSFMLMRAARTVLIPLFGAHLGFDAATIGFIVAVGAAVDVALFYPAGMAMDRYGRRATAVPSSIAFAIVLAAMAFTDSYGGLLLAAIAAGLANGLSTGIVMTLGTDLAPPANRGEFLGLWRLLTDFGAASGPLVVSAVVAIAPLGAAALSVGALGALGSFVVYRYVEETRIA